MHNAGFEHPDLFAKHILVGTVKPQESLRSSWGLRFCILDWQRGLQRRTVPWRVRCRDLAILDATLHRVLASDRVRLRCLRAYLASQPDAPPLGRLAREIRRLAMKRQQDRHIREVGQLPVAAHDQQFVPIDNGRVLVVRSFFEEHADQTLDWRTMPDSSLYTWLNVGERWDIPPLAHTLFRLQRFHVFAPRLMAVGHDGTHTFLLSEAIATLPFVEAYAKAGPGRRAQMLQDAGRLIRQIHDAGYHLPAPESWEHQLGIVAETGAVKLVKVEALQAGKGAWQELGPLEFARRSIRLSRTEQLRFMQSYLEHTAPRARAVKERQATP